MDSALLGHSEIKIETPERVELHFPLASIGNRFLACAFDHFLQLMAVFAVFWVTYAFTNSIESGSTLPEMSRWGTVLLIISLFLIFTSYFIVFEWLWHGQTPGKRLLRLRVLRDDGRPITFWESATRNLLRFFDIMPIPFYSIGLVSSFISPNDQRIGDVFAGTIVVRERTGEAPSFEKTFAISEQDAALKRFERPAQFTADISLLTEKEIEVVELFLRRRLDLEESARKWMAWRVSLPILFKLKPQYDLQTFTYEGFLEEILHRFWQANRFKK